MYEVIKAGTDAALDDLHTAMPGVVDKYDSSTQLADVQPAIKRRFIMPDGTESSRDFPIINNVPICFPRAGDFFLSFPIKKGDSVLLIFSERSIDQWLEKGGKQDPIVTTLHDLSDAIAIPGVYPKTQKLANAHADHVVLGHDGGSALAFFKQALICLGAENPSEFIALATKTFNELSGITGVFNGHTHTVMVPPGTLPVVSFVTSGGPSYSPQSVAATKVKAL